MRLAVELYGTVIGTLEGDARTFDFRPNDEGIARFGVNSSVLSVTVPLLPTQRRDHAKRRRNWFSELLPEGDQYDHMLAQGGLRRADTPGFLARYGRDVAGALQLWDLDDPTEPRAPALRALDATEIKALLEDPIGSPLANDANLGKSSLGGIQPKIVLVRTGSGWAQSLGGHPTTHILKPRLTGALSSVIFDEEFGSRVARRIGLTTFETAIERFDGLDALVIERYDRDHGERLHQEDGNQALGAQGNEKYQEYGGVVSLARMASVLTRFTSADDLERLARMVVLAASIGNLDLHTKNVSLLHPPDSEVRLAPAYDVVPQAHHANDGKLALAVDGVYRHTEITRDHLASEITGWGVHRATVIVEETLEQLDAAVATEAPLPGAFPHLQEQIAAFVTNLREGRRIDGSAP
ncbi:type II toxin-antitoxin system HipA family toxin [Agrococcus sp. KRD186]|uniref:type II toxin-antitoxin system HipA family toxin n=1 Tax=Agrococcus sp. KRD186 TaxID=2729730 RepID=UPI0019D2F7E2|nr:HipA domain-containing protein [Agrococcus sp. KRD186]